MYAAPNSIKRHERRHRRSDNICEAIEMQLMASAERAAFGPMVVGDASGFMIASSGNRNLCEQMAAMSPSLVKGFRTWHGRVLTEKGEVRLSVSPFRFDDSLLYISALGGVGPEIPRELFMSGLGVVRILS